MERFEKMRASLGCVDRRAEHAGKRPWQFLAQRQVIPTVANDSSVRGVPSQ